MKNTNNYIGTIGFIILLIGSIFKGMHYPGANILMTIGSFIGGIYFILSMFYKEKIDASSCALFTEYFLSITMFISVIAFLFKTAHWPGGNIMIGVSSIMFVIFAIAILLSVFRNKDKQFISLTKIIFAVLYLIPILIFFAIPIFYVPG